MTWNYFINNAANKEREREREREGIINFFFWKLRVLSNKKHSFSLSSYKIVLIFIIFIGKYLVKCFTIFSTSIYFFMILKNRVNKQVKNMGGSIQFKMSFELLKYSLTPNYRSFILFWVGCQKGGVWIGHKWVRYINQSILAVLEIWDFFGHFRGFRLLMLIFWICTQKPIRRKTQWKARPKDLPRRPKSEKCPKKEV